MCISSSRDTASGQTVAVEGGRERGGRGGKGRKGERREGRKGEEGREERKEGGRREVGVKVEGRRE